MYAKFHNLVAVFVVMTAVSLIVLVSAIAFDFRDINTASSAKALPGWRTNTSKTLISIDELFSDGPSKDGIPALNAPKFELPISVLRWLPDREPVISVTLGKTTKAYPLQILIWHEIVNDEIAGVPIAVTFCPLSYSASVFKRTVKGRTLTFGVSGMLRNSGMVMYDRQTETLWQQFTGRGLVGDLAGTKLKQIPSQLISFGQFTRSSKKGLVLSRQTGHERPYGENPYVGYDNVSSLPVMFKGDVAAALPPMEKVIGIIVDGCPVAYPCFLTSSKGVINDEICDVPVAVFHNDGAVSALDRQWIRNSRQTGSTAVFLRKIDNHRLTFLYDGKYFIDLQTRSTWTITGKAIEGPLKGKQLTQINHKNSFAFAWLVFNPKTQIYK
jgi:hypothetical protein